MILIRSTEQPGLLINLQQAETFEVTQYEDAGTLHVTAGDARVEVPVTVQHDTWGITVTNRIGQFGWGEFSSFEEADQRLSEIHGKLAREDMGLWRE